jgi:hypothetical protein
MLTSFKVNPSVEVTVNSKDENSEDFCPNCVQEFGLWAAGLELCETQSPASEELHRCEQSPSFVNLYL